MLTIPTRKRRPILPRCPNCGKYRRQTMPRKPRPWWRRSHEILDAAGDRMLSSTGDRILDASGNVQLSDGIGDACCCSTFIPCTCCGTFPPTAIVTISGHTIIHDVCVLTGATSPSYTNTVGTTSMDGTYCMTVDAGTSLNVCELSCLITGLTIRTYADDSCCGQNAGCPKTLKTLTAIKLLFRLSSISGNCFLNFDAQPWDTGGGVASTGSYFQATTIQASVTPAVYCSGGTVSFSNQFSGISSAVTCNDCSFTGLYNRYTTTPTSGGLGYGGTITITNAAC